MPFGSVTLIPGVNAERTPTLLRAGYSQSALVRFKDGLVQKYGGWQLYSTAVVSGIPRELHAWQDINGVGHLAVGTTSQLAVITGNNLRDITPQTLTTNPTPAGTSSSFVSDVSAVALVTDPVLGNRFPTQLNPSTSTLIPGIDAVLVNVPLDIGGILLNGFYQSGNFSVNNQQFAIGVLSGNISGSSSATVPTFTTTNGGSDVLVRLGGGLGRNFVVGQTVYFNVPTTGNGVTISGQYQIIQIGPFGFMINAGMTANASGSFSMNGGNAGFTYYLATGNYPANETTGTPLAASDWTMDNWGTILLACPVNGPVFQWTPGQIGTAQPIGSAPLANGGIFVSNAQQVLICWGTSGPNLNSNSIQLSSFGFYQNPLQVAWSDSGNYTSFIPTTQNLAGSFVIPTGSAIRGGLSVANQNLIWTDLDLWAMNWIGYPFSYGFNKIGDGAGLISRHALQHLRGSVFWWGPNNFFSYDGNGVRAIPCAVWDAVFQNLNQAFTQNIRAMPNSLFNEVGWFYPSEDSVSGECDSYVKFNITEPNAPWDYGLITQLQRSAWIDQSILGTPIGADTSGNIWQHEQGNDAAGSPMISSFTTGYFYLEEGEDFAFVDQVLPDFKWSLFSEVPSATIQISFNVVNYPGDTPNVYGPYTVTQATEYISTRFRGRLMSITVSSSDLGSFWRIGSMKYRYSAAGRR